MNNRNSPRQGHGPYMRHGGHGQGQNNFSSSPNESPISFHFGGNTPIPPEHMVYAQPSNIAAPSELLPAAPSSNGELIQKADSSDSKSSGFSLPSLSDLKGMVDRLGGIDGIISSVSKVQKVVASVSQMAPLLKVLFSSFKKSNNKSSGDDEWRPRPRKRRRKTGSTGNSVKRRRPATGKTKRRKR